MPSTSASVPSDESFDPFGRDPDLERRVRPVLDSLLDKVFRASLEGVETVPAGPSILVCNHGGALPWDALVLIAAVGRALGRPVRPLVEDAVMTAPFIGTFMNRLGCVRASQDNAMRLLAKGAVTAVFPEGMQGLGKLWRHRGKLQRFGRGGFVRLAHKAGVPILPTAIVGGEDTAPLFAKIELFFRGNDLIPYLPLTPVLPLPARWKLKIGAPIDVRAEVPDLTDSDVQRLASRVREIVQKDVDALTAARGSVYF